MNHIIINLISPYQCIFLLDIFYYVSIANQGECTYITHIINSCMKRYVVHLLRLIRWTFLLPCNDEINLIVYLYKILVTSTTIQFKTKSQNKEKKPWNYSMQIAFCQRAIHIVISLHSYYLSFFQQQNIAILCNGASSHFGILPIQ